MTALDDAPDLLFAYGTLLPGETRWGFLAPFVRGEGAPDAVAGWLYDTGRGYPAARFAWDPVVPEGPAGDVALVHGRAFELDPARRDEALQVLDDVEGAVAGLYRRVVVTLETGRRAVAYEYGSGLDLRPIPSGRWVDAAV